MGACAAHGLARTGTQEELQKRLGDHLVAQLLFGEPKATNGGRKPGVCGQWQLFWLVCHFTRIR